jgi:hypothetical protein
MYPTAGGRLPGHRQVVAGELGAGRADVLLPARYYACRLHDEHDRIAEHDAAQGEQESGVVPE